MSLRGLRPGSAWAANQTAFLLAIAAIYVAEEAEPTVTNIELFGWLCASVATWLWRTCLYSARTLAVHEARDRVAKVLGTSIPLFGLLYWSWTVQMFIGENFSTTAVVLLMAFAMMSIAVMGSWMQAPRLAVFYVVALWLVLSVKAAASGLISGPVLVVMDTCVALMVMLAIYAYSRMRPLLDRSIEADRLVGEMQRTNEQLEQMRQEAATTLANRSTFFAGASHDFKQRLHAMKLMAYSTIAGLPPDDKARWALSRMSDEVEELESYFKHILEFARIEASDIDPQLEEISIQKVLQSIDLQFENAAAERDIRLSFRPTDVRVHSDATMLQRMLENLVSNAVKFTRGGVLVAARKRGNDVIVEVWDQGPGIREEARAVIFEAFRQDGTSSVNQAGVGLGLFLVKRFSERLGCSVSVDSRVGRGSVFRLRMRALGA